MVGEEGLEGQGRVAGFFGGLSAGLVWLACLRPWLTLLLITLLSAGALWLSATRLEINTSTEDMLSPDLPFREAAYQVREAFPAQGQNFCQNILKRREITRFPRFGPNPLGLRGHPRDLASECGRHFGLALKLAADQAHVCRLHHIQVRPFNCVEPFGNAWIGALAVAQLFKGTHPLGTLRGGPFGHDGFLIPAEQSRHLPQSHHIAKMIGQRRISCLGIHQITSII